MKGDYIITVDREAKMKIWKKKTGHLIQNEWARNGRKIKNKKKLEEIRKCIILKKRMKELLDMETQGGMQKKKKIKVEIPEREKKIQKLKSK